MAKTKKSCPWALGIMDLLVCCVTMVKSLIQPRPQVRIQKPALATLLEGHVLDLLTVSLRLQTPRVLLLFPTKTCTSRK